ncbi:MAG: hypothetical protein ACK4NS_02405 [Saprospiraceae bacterium]
MKKLFVFLAFVLAVGISTADAQSCGQAAAAGKSCCASKKMADLSPADKAAASDPSIFKMVDNDGATFYTRKETDAAGNARFVSVQYDEATNAFVNVAPKSQKAEMTKKTATGGAAAPAKACCAGGAQKASCTPSEKKACAGAKVEQ